MPPRFAMPLLVAYWNSKFLLSRWTTGAGCPINEAEMLAGMAQTSTAGKGWGVSGYSTHPIFKLKRHHGVD